LQGQAVGDRPLFAPGEDSVRSSPAHKDRWRFLGLCGSLPKRTL
jgi:hypothetical protein